MYKKGLVLGIICLFIGASVVPSITGNIEEINKNNISFFEKTIEKTPMESFECETADIESLGSNSAVLFFDDFNDNDIDYSSWLKYCGDGNCNWWERNQRVELQIYERESTPCCGIISKGINCKIDSANSVIIDVDMITDIDHSIGQNAGKIIIKVTDGTNYVAASYRRDGNIISYWDSKGTSETFIKGNQEDGIWGNTIEIHGNQYNVTMNGEYSGWKDKQIFFGDCTTIQVALYLECDGGSSGYYWIAGFDNVSVIGTEAEEKKLEFLPTSHYFGYADEDKCSDEKTFILRNTGDTWCNGSVYLDQNDQFEIISGGESFSLEPGKNKEILVRFCPTSEGTKTSRLIAEGDCNYVYASLIGCCRYYLGEMGALWDSPFNTPSLSFKPYFYHEEPDRVAFEFPEIDGEVEMCFYVNCTYSMNADLLIPRATLFRPTLWIEGEPSMTFLFNRESDRILCNSMDEKTYRFNISDEDFDQKLETKGKTTIVGVAFNIRGFILGFPQQQIFFYIAITPIPII